MTSRPARPAPRRTRKASPAGPSLPAPRARHVPCSPEKRAWRCAHWTVVLVACALFFAPRAAAQPNTRGTPAGRALALLRTSAETYSTQRDCFSCHHQALPVWAQAAAGSEYAEPGFLQSQAAFSAAWFSVRSASLRNGHGLPGGPYTAGYALLTLSAAGMSEDPAADDLVAYLLATQEQDGRWSIRTHRPPLEDSDFTATALAVRGLLLAAPLAQADQIQQRIARASRWLADHAALTGEDRAYRLLGLAWCEADPEQVAKAAAVLRAAQRDDGGWAQLEDLPSDAYATGQALAALRLSRAISPRHPVYERGLAWLSRRQLADGSWHVSSRSRPFQEYFESGFPHGPDQFISAAATSWAVLAMVPADDPGAAASERRLPALLVERLRLMREVARWKWLNQRPISDPPRERELLWSFTRKAAQAGIEPHRARSFLQAQIAAARAVQQAEFEAWQSGSSPAPRTAADLEHELRPRIDALTAELAADLAVWDRLDPASQQTAIEQVHEARMAADLPAQAVQLALAPLAPPPAMAHTHAH